MRRKTMNNIIVLFGSTGDLTYRKLMPAFTKLYKESLIDSKFRVIAVGRRDYNNQDYLNYIKENNEDLDLECISLFTEYYKMQITDSNDYKGLKEYIKRFSNENTKVISYMAVAPYFFEEVALNVSKANIIEKGNKKHSIIFEKPFGNSLSSAKALNKSLWDLYDEEQIYRIDNYLAKRVVQHLLPLRFKSEKVKEIWKVDNVKEIEIISREPMSILGRGSFYEETGALRDMVQSHLLQVLSLLALKTPNNFDAEAITNKKVEFLNSLKVDNVKLGQYEGYLEEDKVADDSNTETFAYLELSSKLDVLKDIKVTILNGKKLDAKVSKIKVTLKSNKVIEITFAPEDKIVVDNKDITNSELSNDNQVYDYNKVLLDAINQDKHLFIRWDEVEATWKLIDNIYDLELKVFKYLDYKDVLSKI